MSSFHWMLAGDRGHRSQVAVRGHTPAQAQESQMAVRSVSSYCIGQVRLGVGKLSYACKPYDGRAWERAGYGAYRTIRTLARSCVWLVVPIILSGCASFSEYTPTSKIVKTPSANSVSIAQVGDEILTQGTITEHDAVLVENAINVGSPLLLNTYKIHPGYYLKERSGNAESVYSPAKGELGGKIDALGSSWAFPAKFVSINEVEEICVNLGGKSTILLPCARSSDFRLTTYTYLKSEDVRQTLIYSGKDENKIKVGYREYSGSAGRPAIHNDIEYDLNNSNVISYKGSKIEVVEATSGLLKYRVIQYFNE